jgi:hypothetical protein
VRVGVLLLQLSGKGEAVTEEETDLFSSDLPKYSNQLL